MESIDERCNKYDYRSNLGVGVSGKPIDTAKNDLIYLFSFENIGFERINRRDQVDWLSREIRSYIRGLVYCIYRGAIGGEFYER